MGIVFARVVDSRIEFATGAIRAEVSIAGSGSIFAVRTTSDLSRIAVSAEWGGPPSANRILKTSVGATKVFDGTGGIELRLNEFDQPNWSACGTMLVLHRKGKIYLLREPETKPVELMKVSTNLGPVSASFNPSGSRIACIKWKGDDKHIATVSVDGSEAVVHRPSCFTYSWLDDDSIAFVGMTSIKRLGVATGKTSTLVPLDGEQPREPLKSLLMQAYGHPLRTCRFEKVRAGANRLFFEAFLTTHSKDSGRTFILSCTHDGKDFRLEGPMGDSYNTVYLDGDRISAVVKHGKLLQFPGLQQFDPAIRIVMPASMPEFGFTF